MIPKGTLLHSSEPFVYSLSEIVRRTHCNYCFKREPIKMCKGCYYVGYCDEECQMKAWLDHKQECKDIKSNTLCNEIIGNDVRLLAKVIRKIKKQSNRDVLFNLVPNNHFSKDDVERKFMVKELYEKLCGFMGAENVPKDDELYEIIDRIYLNTFPVYDMDMLCIGHAIHLVPGLKHGCNPKTVFAHWGRTIYITAVQDLPEIDWNNLTAAFIYAFFGVDDRIWNKGLEFRSECNCKKCSDVQLKEALCPNKSCRGSCNIDDDTCPNCGITLSDDFKSAFNKTLELTLRCLNSPKDHYNHRLLQICYKKLSDVAQPTNCALVRIIERLYLLDEFHGQYVRATNYLERTIKGFEYYFTGYDFGIALLHYKLAKFRMQLDNIDGYYQELDETHRIFSFIYGEIVGPKVATELIQRTLKRIAQSSKNKPKKKLNLYS